MSCLLKFETLATRLVCQDLKQRKELFGKKFKSLVKFDTKETLASSHSIVIKTNQYLLGSLQIAINKQHAEHTAIKLLKYLPKTTSHSKAPATGCANRAYHFKNASRINLKSI